MLSLFFIKVEHLILNKHQSKKATTCCFNPGVLTLAGVCLWRSSSSFQTPYRADISPAQKSVFIADASQLFLFNYFENISPLISTEMTEAQIQNSFAGACPGPRSAALIPQELIQEQRDRSHLYSSSLYQPHIHTGLYSVHFMHIISMTTLEWPFTQACMSWLWED